MKKIRFSTWVYWILSFVPLLLTAACYPSLPEKVPMHYNLYGEIDRWGNRREMWIFPAMIPILALLFWGLLHLAQKSVGQKPAELEERRITSKRVIAASRLILLGIFDLLAISILAVTLYGTNGEEMTIDFMRILAAGLSIVDILLGNLMPKVRQNTVMGIRTPWTLESEEVWYRTHRFGGIAMCIGGILGLLGAIIWKGTWAFALYLIGTLGSMFAAVVYSWRISKK
ncbi:MAG: SdpI family protein [Candidatus Merdivicinus sp.]